MVFDLMTIISLGSSELAGCSRACVNTLVDPEPGGPHGLSPAYMGPDVEACPLDSGLLHPALGIS